MSAWCCCSRSERITRKTKTNPDGWIFHETYFKRVNRDVSHRDSSECFSRTSRSERGFLAQRIKVSRTRRIAAKTWMFWPITVFFKNFNSCTTPATSLRCRRWRKTGSRWTAFCNLLKLFLSCVFACQWARARARNFQRRAAKDVYCVFPNSFCVTLGPLRIKYCIALNPLITHIRLSLLFIRRIVAWQAGKLRSE